MTQMKEARADRRGRPLVPASFCDGYVPALLSSRAGYHSDDEWLPSASAAAAVGCDSHTGQKPACVSLPPLLQTLTQLPPLPVTPPRQMIIRSLLLLRLLLFYEPVRRQRLKPPRLFPHQSASADLRDASEVIAECRGRQQQ